MSELVANGDSQKQLPKNMDQMVLEPTKWLKPLLDKVENSGQASAMATSLRSRAVAG